MLKKLSIKEMLSARGGKTEVRRWLVEGEGWYIEYDDGTVGRDSEVDPG